MTRPVSLSPGRHVAALLTGCLLAIVFAAPGALAAPVTTAFTYQGSLDRAGLPLGTGCTFQFKLFDALSLGGQLGPTLTPSVTVYDNGQFSCTLDFGAGVFDGNARWLEIAVQCTGDASLVPLTPRQPITVAPYALYALSAPGGGAGFTLPYAGAVTSNALDAFRVQNNSTSTALSAIHGVLASTTAGGAGAVFGEATATSGLSLGVNGLATASPSGTGVVGKGGATGGYFESFAPTTLSGYAGLFGVASNTYGVRGISTTSFGVYGSGTDGVHGTGSNAGLFGDGTSYGVVGTTVTGKGVLGITTTGYAVQGEANNLNALGVFGTNPLGDGVWGQSNAVGKSGVVGVNYNVGGVGVWAQNNAGGVALYANGLAQVKTLQILGADLAESFPVEGEGAEPGTVLAIAGSGEGTLRVCDEAYCARVAGVVSGAHGLPAGVVLKGAAFDDPGQATVAMSGRVWVKCDAARAPIRVGDLLTTSNRAGHAMRATDTARGTGAILGKAMTSLETGSGLVLVLVSLQ